MSKLSRWVGRRLQALLSESVGSLVTGPYPPQCLTWFGRGVEDRTERQRGGNSWERFAADKMVFVARQLELYNPFAQAILGALKGYCLGAKGMTVTCVAKAGKDAKLATVAQACIDRFRGVNKWLRKRERETYVRAHRDGNALLRFWAEDGEIRCGYIEPEALQPKDGSEEWTFGLKHQIHNPERIEAYGVQWAAGDWEEIDAWWVLHLKCNVDECIKLGVSDFASTGEILESCFKNYKNYSAAEAVRQSYTYICQHAPGPDPAAIQELLNAQANVTIPAHGGPHFQFPEKKIEIREGVGVEHVPDSMQFAAMPSAEGTQGMIAGINASLLAAGVRYQMPLWLIAGDMSQNNVVDLGDESGFATYIRGEQAWYGAFQRDIYLKVLEIAAEYGLFGVTEAVLDAVEVDVKPQSPPPRDPLAATQRFKILKDANRVSGRTWDAAEGLDTDKEQEAIQKEAPAHLIPALAAANPPVSLSPTPVSS